MDHSSKQSTKHAPVLAILFRGVLSRMPRTRRNVVLQAAAIACFVLALTIIAAIYAPSKAGVL